ncbi:sucrase ferredoxin [Nocardia jejuensis]|uniref:sucrase ferredoxin n=1 Tax=Nocardia jejuensis TaxID=328049 RepID=UPI000832B347|nr:sucrase ferredoxin [Nocardia jejuensis]
MTEFAGLSCSVAAQEIPLPGSATRITGWLCVEQPGAWGRDVIGDAVLGPEITPELGARTKAARVRPTLIRRPGRSEFSGVRTVLIASSRPEGSWCERLEITDPKELLDLDLHLLNGPAPGLGAAVTDPLTLVCAHGKRDRCCALLGRPIAADLAAEYPDQVWECSHTGGHRFAPAVIVLPTGLTYGRLTPAQARATVAAARRGEISLPGLRGRSCYTPVEQIAEIAVRRLITDESSTRAFDTVADRDANSVSLRVEPAAEDAEFPRDPADFAGAAVVTHPDGRRWLVTTRTVAYAPRQASCGASPKPATAVVADRVHALS